jgi:tetratricopeptide (TPR) repeat protein
MATFPLRAVAKNVAIIGAGSAAMIWWDNHRKSAAPRQVRDLAYEAAALQGAGTPLPDDTNNSALARRKWKEAIAISEANVMSPKISFNLAFALACNLEESGHVEQAEDAFKKALASFPVGFDIHSLEENTRNRVAVTLDRLAQREQDRGKMREALVLYERALDAVASPQEVASMSPTLLERKAHVETVAGILNNLAGAYFELGHKAASDKVLQKSELFMNALNMSSVNIDSGASLQESM